MELIVGHNGIERLSSQGGGMNRGTQGRAGFQGGGQRMDGGRNQPQGGNQPNTPPAQPGQNNGGNTGTSGPANGNASGNPPSQGSNTPGQFGRDGGGQRQGGAVGNDIGTAGVLRLWNAGMLGQASWLIVFVLFCIAVKIRRFDWRHPTLKQGVFCYWILWLATMYFFFSFAGFFHRYYLCMLAPGIAGLVGIGLPALIRAFRERDGWRQWLLPISLTSTAAIEIQYVWSYEQLRTWLVPLIAVAAACALTLMVIYRLGCKRFLMTAATGFLLVSILAAPFYWSLTAILYVPQNSTMPYAGPELATDTYTAGMTANQETYVTADSETLSLEKYLVSHYKQGSYLVAAASANDVAGFIVDTGLPAVAYGGFMGTDNAMTLEQLKALVQQGKITYFLVSGRTGFGAGSNSALTSYVKENAALIDPSEYGGTSAQSGSGIGLNGASLYCFAF